MKIELYEALTGLNIEPATAKVVIASLGEHIDMQVTRANEALLAKLDGMQMAFASGQANLSTKLDALASGRIDPVEKAVGLLVNDKQLRVQRLRWVVGSMIGTISGGLAILHAMHVL